MKRYKPFRRGIVFNYTVLLLHLKLIAMKIANYNVVDPQGWEDQPVKTGDFIPVYNTYPHQYNTKTGHTILVEEAEGSKTPGVLITRELLYYFKHLLGLHTKYEVFAKLNTLCVSISKEDAAALEGFFSRPLENDRTEKYTAWSTWQRYAARFNPLVLKKDVNYDPEKHPFIIWTPPTKGAHTNRRKFARFTAPVEYVPTTTTIILTNLREGRKPFSLYKLTCISSRGKNVTYSRARNWLESEQTPIRHIAWRNSSATRAHWINFHVLVTESEPVINRGKKVTMNSRSGNINRYEW